ncbi:hypothetical protein J6590_030598 [Homalodisca vitripennis]|nr:hypothetical protein J6590_030598 [Homalodisca vitripennis]
MACDLLVTRQACKQLTLRLVVSGSTEQHTSDHKYRTLSHPPRNNFQPICRDWLRLSDVDTQLMDKWLPNDGPNTCAEESQNISWLLPIHARSK